MLIYDRIPGLDELAVEQHRRNSWRWYGGTVPTEPRTVPVQIVHVRPDVEVRPPDHGTTDRFDAGCRCVVCVDRQVVIGRIPAVVTA